MLEAAGEGRWRAGLGRLACHCPFAPCYLQDAASPFRLVPTKSGKACLTPVRA
jgi:hypothetical protein